MAKLQCGVAAIFQNNWIQPVLCKVGEYTDFDKNFIYQKADTEINRKTSAILDLKQYAMGNVEIDNIKLKEKIEAVDIADYKTLEQGFIASLFRNNEQVFKDAIRITTSEKTKLPGLRDYLVSHLEPSLSDYKKDYLEHILTCIVLENCRKDFELIRLPEMWNTFISRNEDSKDGKLI